MASQEVVPLSGSRNAAPNHQGTGLLNFGRDVLACHHLNFCLRKTDRDE